MATAARLSRSDSAAPAVNDVDLVTRAQEGDDEAFTALYRRHRPRVRAICCRVMRDAGPARAEEAEQEAWLQVWKKIGSFRGDSLFSTWLYRVAANTCLMSLRRRELQTVAYEAAAGDGDDREWEPSDQWSDARGVVADIDLSAALASLAPGYRQAVIMCDVLGMEHQEVAAVTGKSTGNSKSQLHKARAVLRQKLGRLA